jgi:hypothetical protein
LSYNGNSFVVCTSGVWVVEPVTIGTQTASCTSPLAGQVQWNGSALQYCSGTSWTTVASGVAGSGTTNYLARWTPNGTTLGIGATYDNGTQVGIGTASPRAELDVEGTGLVNIFSSSTDVTTSSVGNVEALADSSELFMASHASARTASRYGLTLGGWTEISAFNNNGTTNGLVIGATTAKPLVFGTNSAERMRIDSSGNVGIGTTSPQSPLEVLQSNSSVPTLPFVTLQNPGTGSAQVRLSLELGGDVGAEPGRGSVVFATAGSSGWADYEGRPLLFFTGATAGGGASERMRITPSGTVGIGTTTPAANGLTINNSVSPTVTFELGGTSEEYLYDDGSYFYVMSTSAGNGVKLQHGSTLWTSSSDRRIKKDIAALPASYGLSAVELLKPVTFHWRDPKSPQELQMGLVAQDVQQVIPELVTRSGPTRYAPDGELGIEYSGLVIPLIKAIQELKADNDDLKAANDNEVAQIKALSARLDAIETTRHCPSRSRPPR